MKEVTFFVESDSTAPMITRVFNEDSRYLTIMTSEKATCVYDTKSCGYLFDDGNPITSANDLKHSITWDSASTYYIKCKDEYNNQPAPNQCNIVVRPYDVAVTV